MLDTKNFVLNTGVRTFEASAYLRRRGRGHRGGEKKLFSDSLETYKQKAQLVSGAEILQGLRHRPPPARTTATSASRPPRRRTSCCPFWGLKASFVLYRSGNDVGVSARSLGDVNVQVILEEVRRRRALHRRRRPD